MKCEYRQLGDVAIQFIDGDRGKNYPSNNEFSNVGYCLFLNAKNVTPDGFSFGEVSFITQKKDAMLRKGKLEKNDVVLTTRGTVGNVAFYGERVLYSNVRINSGMLIIRPDPSVFCPEYVYWLFRSDVIQDQIKRFRSGTAQPQLPISSIKKFEIPLVDIKTQKEIAAILSALDEKIAINRAINDNLQQQLRTIFKAEFTDNPELENITQIPLSELCHVVTKGTTPTTLGKPFVESGINFIKAESILDDHSIDKSKFAFIDEETNSLLKRSIIHVGDVVFTIAGTLGRFALIDENVLPANTNQAVAIIRADVEKVLPEYIYTCFIGELHTDYYAKRVQQAVQANLSLTTIKSLPIPLLDEEKMSEYLNLILPLIKAIKTNEAQNEKLVAFRDNLLPKLMSGEIDVSAVQL